MEDKKLLIVGIDPGTTVGYAVIDIEGNLIHLDSSKQLDLKQLISKTIGLGKVVLVGTDKAKVPHFVETFATKLGSTVVIPQEDLQIKEKKELTRIFNFDDEHQCDALASALFAYRETKKLLDKIDSFVEANKKYNIKDKIKELVITRKISIKSAASLIEKKDEEPQFTEKTVVERKPNETDLLRLHDKIRRYENELRLLRRYNRQLKNRIHRLEKQLNLKETKPEKIRRMRVSPRTRSQLTDFLGPENLKNFLGNQNEVIDFREKRINFLSNLTNLKERDIRFLKLTIGEFVNVLSNINDFYILKKLSTLAMNEFNFKNKILNIQRNDILLVDNPNVVSDNTVNLLKNKVFVIIHKKPISKKIENRLPFIFISAKNLKINEHEHLGFVEKKHFETEKSKINWIKKIVEDYKKEKEQLIG